MVCTSGVARSPRVILTSTRPTSAARRRPGRPGASKGTGPGPWTSRHFWMRYARSWCPETKQRVNTGTGEVKQIKFFIFFRKLESENSVNELRMNHDYVDVWHLSPFSCLIKSIFKPRVQRDEFNILCGKIKKVFLMFLCKIMNF